MRKRLSLRGEEGLRKCKARVNRLAGSLDLLCFLASWVLSLAMALAIIEMGAFAGVDDTKNTER